MIVTCEACNTKFRLDAARLKGQKSKLRCSRCGHIFDLKNPEEDDDFIHVDLSDDTAPEDELVAGPPPIPGPITSPLPRRKGILRTVLLWTIPLIILGVVVFVAATHKEKLSQEPAAVDNKTPAAEAKQATVTISDATQAYFLQNGQGGQIFVVEGDVVNESKQPISFILLEGKLYTKENKVGMVQRCFAGNVMSRDDLKKLGIAEIQNRMMNREGKDLMNVHVPPLKHVPFQLVFHDLPALDSLNDYSIEFKNAKVD
jgi:predicted Zn finger-like uncharacterized protein